MSPVRRCVQFVACGSSGISEERSPVPDWHMDGFSAYCDEASASQEPLAPSGL